MRPHVLGIDDAPFVKERASSVPLVAVMMEGSTIVEGVAVQSFPIDGPDATGFLSEWIGSMRWRPSLQAVILGGITIAGLGLIDLPDLHARTGLPILSVTRRDTSGTELGRALTVAGLDDRLEILDRAPTARRVQQGLFLSCAGVDHHTAERILRSTLNKSLFPEPLRLAHLIGAALVHGQSRGRV